VTQTLYPSLDVMLRPDVIGRLLGENVVEVHLTDVTTDVANSSGSGFLNVTLNGESRPRLFVKRIDGTRDWMARVTHDDLCRSTTLWQHRLLDRFPPEFSTGVIACAKEEQGHAILMINVHDDLMPLGTPMTAQDNDAILDAMAALHATFWLDPALLDPNLGLCRPDEYFMLLPPERVTRILQERPAGVLRTVREGWEVLPGFIGAGAAEHAQSMANEARVLGEAMSRYPWTLTHGDVRAANLAVRRNEVAEHDAHRVVALDMARAGRTPPALDLAWYLSWASELRFDKADVIEGYRTRLEVRLGARFDLAWWRPQLDLALMTSALLLMPLFAGLLHKYYMEDPSRQDRLDNILWMSECVEIGAARLRSLA
jgi:hypothetical protein